MAVYSPLALSSAEMLDEIYKTTYDHVHRLITGSINRFQKLRWLGKLLIVFLILAYIALAIIVVTIGPATLFQVGGDF
jgi:hypothetical protein